MNDWIAANGSSSNAVVSCLIDITEDVRDKIKTLSLGFWDTVCTWFRGRETLKEKTTTQWKSKTSDMDADTFNTLESSLR